MNWQELRVLAVWALSSAKSTGSSSPIVKTIESIISRIDIQNPGDIFPKLLATVSEGGMLIAPVDGRVDQDKLKN